ncbi:cytochrome P450-dit2 [Pleurotus pulmonarius]|nr:cytochrome P450-dit2 [Pleurotus pulmonarius]
MALLSTLTLAIEAALIYAVSWVVWRTLRQYVVQSCLDNIPGPPSVSLWKGNLGQIFDTDGWNFHLNLAKTYGPVAKIHGLFGDKQLYIYDPKAMHHVIVKDQDIYEETSLFIQGNLLMFGPGLLSTLGSHHKKQRKMLNPVFSIAHMRQMVPTFHAISNQLRDSLAKRCADGPKEIDMLRWISRAALELIAQSGLGHSFDSLQKDELPHAYIVVMKKLQPTIFSMVIARNFLPWLVKIGTPSFRRWAISMSPWKKLREIRDMVDFMHNTSREIYNSKKKAIAEGDEAVLRQVGQGKDIMSILMRANLEASDEDKLPDEELLAQELISIYRTLTFAAVDTTSGALARTLHLLSEHPEVQAKVRAEIRTAKEKFGGDLPYDELVSLPYLDAVCRETLRLYPPISYLSRTTRKDAVLPLQDPIRGIDGNTISEIHIPSNTNVIVGLRASNTNPQLWGADALEWKPERWLSQLPDALQEAHVPGIYSNLMTFLGGGRACIGFKFSQLEMKAVLSALMETFGISPPASEEIAWNMTAIATPTVKRRTSMMPQLPLNLALAK